jgi:hypothetical protein
MIAIPAIPAQIDASAPAVVVAGEYRPATIGTKSVTVSSV